ncbi:hypothetical protein [Pyrobaculum calidifontis]|nr:hypothetical protein [Pyrobaculum calidifontis]
MCPWHVEAIAETTNALATSEVRRRSPNTPQFASADLELLGGYALK